MCLETGAPSENAFDQHGNHKPSHMPGNKPEQHWWEARAWISVPDGLWITYSRKNSVKPVLVVTCIEQPPTFKGQHFNFNSILTCIKRPPIFKGHVNPVPQPAAEDRLECKSTRLFKAVFCIMCMACRIFRSTDSQLKLWTTSKSTSVRTFNGHINEKNFVGLATDGDYVACGKNFSNRFCTSFLWTEMSVEST